MRRWRPIAAGVILICAFAAACSPPPPKVVTVLVQEMNYAQPSVQIHQGDTVEWVNKDIFVHSATSTTGGFDVELPVGGTGRATFKHAGEFDYFCRYHPGMKGRVLVTD